MYDETQNVKRLLAERRKDGLPVDAQTEALLEQKMATLEKTNDPRARAHQLEAIQANLATSEPAYDSDRVAKLASLHRKYAGTDKAELKEAMKEMEKTWDPSAQEHQLAAFERKLKAAQQKNRR